MAWHCRQLVPPSPAASVSNGLRCNWVCCRRARTLCADDVGRLLLMTAERGRPHRLWKAWVREQEGSKGAMLVHQQRTLVHRQQLPDLKSLRLISGGLPMLCTCRQPRGSCRMHGSHVHAWRPDRGPLSRGLGPLSRGRLRSQIPLRVSAELRMFVICQYCMGLS